MDPETTSAGQPTGPSSLVADEPLPAQERLQRLKAQVLTPETKSERIARALEALQKALKPWHLDPASLRHIAQHADLEGF